MPSVLQQQHSLGPKSSPPLLWSWFEVERKTGTEQLILLPSRPPQTLLQLRPSLAAGR